MKKMYGLVLCLIAVVGTLQAQDKFFTKTAKISFFSSATLEDIEAHNRSTQAVLDTKTGDMQFSLLMKGFEFKKALMQEHFNKNFVESDKYPKAEFKGQVVNNSEINYTTNGTYTARVKGRLTLHGQSKDIETSGTIIVKDGKLAIHSTFNVLVSDFNITIPRMYTDNISKSIRVTVDATLAPL
jgi:polyisoprenoid-binding protein YceI